MVEKNTIRSCSYPPVVQGDHFMFNVFQQQEGMCLQTFFKKKKNLNQMLTIHEKTF